MEDHEELPEDLRKLVEETDQLHSQDDWREFLDRPEVKARTKRSLDAPIGRRARCKAPCSGERDGDPSSRKSRRLNSPHEVGIARFRNRRFLPMRATLSCKC